MAGDRSACADRVNHKMWGQTVTDSSLQLSVFQGAAMVMALMAVFPEAREEVLRC